MSQMSDLAQAAVEEYDKNKLLKKTIDNINVLVGNKEYKAVHLIYIPKPEDGLLPIVRLHMYDDESKQPRYGEIPDIVKMHTIPKKAKTETQGETLKKEEKQSYRKQDKAEEAEVNKLKRFLEKDSKKTVTKAELKDAVKGIITALNTTVKNFVLEAILESIIMTKYVNQLQHIVEHSDVNATDYEEKVTMIKSLGATALLKQATYNMKVQGPDYVLGMQEHKTEVVDMVKSIHLTAKYRD